MSKSVKLIECVGVSRAYHDGENTVSVLKDLNLSVDVGQRLAVVGPSGSGKSTLLHLLGGLDKPTEGNILIHGEDWQSLSEKSRCRWRNQHIGFVYQFHHLLPEFTALENVMMPLLLAGRNIDESRHEAESILTEVGLATRCFHKPAQLSGGERQRVAIARALAPKPDCVLADEPTGNLDRATAEQVFDVMLELNASKNVTLIVVTHDGVLAERLGPILNLGESH